MANTYTLITSNTVGSGGVASFTFSAIPSTYTDLVLTTSLRTNHNAGDDALRIIVNNDAGSTTYWSFSNVRAASSTASAVRDAGYPWMEVWNSNAITSTSDTFSSSELYFPNYAGNQKKQISAFNVRQNNSTNASLAAQAFLRDTTDAISSIQITPDNGTSFLQYSSFYLYGIKNS
jgi:hypothetical protein